jgi:hypothetical protein
MVFWVKFESSNWDLSIFIAFLCCFKSTATLHRRASLLNVIHIFILSYGPLVQFIAESQF